MRLDPLHPGFVNSHTSYFLVFVLLATTMVDQMLILQFFPNQELSDC
jgi:hypothetical protein